MDAFYKHDMDKDGYLERIEMATALADLGLLQGLTPCKLAAQIDEFLLANQTSDNDLMTMEEFVSLGRHLSNYRSQPEVRQRIRNQLPTFPYGAESNTHLRRVFKVYCMSQVDNTPAQNPYDVLNMTCQQFHQLCHDASLLQPLGKFSVMSVYVAFAQCKPGKGRRLSWRCFLDAMALFAYDAGKTFDEITSGVVGLQFNSSVKVVADATAATRLFNRLTQLKSTYKFAATSKFPSGTGRFPSICDMDSTSFSGDLSKSMRDRVQYGRSASSTGTSPHRRPVSAPPARSAAADNGTAHQGSPTGNARHKGDTEQSGCDPHLQQENGGSPCADKLWEHGRHSLEKEVGKSLAGLAKRHDLDVLRRGVLDMFAALDDRLQKAEEARRRTFDNFASQSNARMELLESQANLLNQNLQQLGSLTQQNLTVQRELIDMHKKAGDNDGSLSTLSSKIGLLQEGLTVLMGELGIVKASTEQQQSLNDKAHALPTTMPASADQVRTLEAMVMDRQARVEGALMQVARKVDELDIRLRSEQESSIKALEAILASANQDSDAAAATA